MHVCLRNLFIPQILLCLSCIISSTAWAHIHPNIEIVEPNPAVLNPFKEHFSKPIRFSQLSMFGVDGNEHVEVFAFERVDFSNETFGAYLYQTYSHFLDHVNGHKVRFVLLGRADRLEELKSGLIRNLSDFHQDMVLRNGTKKKLPSLESASFETIPFSNYVTDIGASDHHPSTATLKDSFSTPAEFRAGVKHGILMGIGYGTIFLINTGDFLVALKAFALTVLARTVSTGLRPPISHIKRLLNGYLARTFDNKALRLTLGLSYMTFIDVLVGMATLFVPGALLGVFPWAQDLSVAAPWFRMLKEQFIHSATDLFSYARDFREGEGVISRRVANWINIIKPYISVFLSALRVNDVGWAYYVNYAIGTIGLGSLLVSWPHVFHLFRGGQVVVGPDMRNQFVSRRNSGGLRFVYKVPDSRFQGQGRYEVTPFWGYTPYEKDGERFVVLDPTLFFVSIDEIRVSQAGEPIENLLLKKALLEAMVQSDYEIKGDAVFLPYQGRIYELNFGQMAGVDLASNGTAPATFAARALNKQEELLKKTLFESGNLKIARVREALNHSGDGDQRGFLISIEGLTVYNRGAFHTVKDSNNRFQKPNKTLQELMTYMTKVNMEQGRYYSVLMGDDTFLNRARMHLSLIWEFFGKLRRNRQRLTTLTSPLKNGCQQ